MKVKLLDYTEYKPIETLKVLSINLIVLFLNLNLNLKQEGLAMRREYNVVYRILYRGSSTYLLSKKVLVKRNERWEEIYRMEAWYSSKPLHVRKNSEGEEEPIYYKKISKGGSVTYGREGYRANPKWAEDEKLRQKLIDIIEELQKPDVKEVYRYKVMEYLINGIISTKWIEQTYRSFVLLKNHRVSSTKWLKHKGIKVEEKED